MQSDYRDESRHNIEKLPPKKWYKFAFDVVAKAKGTTGRFLDM